MLSLKTKIRLLILAAVFLPTLSGAATLKGLKPALKDLNNNLNLLIAVKQSDLDTEEKIKLEINTRQAAFNNIIDITLTEITLLKARLEELLKDEQIQQLLTDLEGFIAYHQTLRKQINRELELKELTNIGRQFKLWRELTSQPKINQIADLLLAAHNEKIIAMAGNRLEKIKNDRKKIKSFLSPAQWQHFEELFTKAELAVALAQELEKTAPDAVPQKIKEAYFSFLEMSSLIKK